jgi:hypothetical protein
VSFDVTVIGGVCLVSCNEIGNKEDAEADRSFGLPLLQERYDVILPCY